MNLLSTFRPKPHLSEAESARGLRWLIWEGTSQMGFNSITSSGFLAAFALLMGANNLQIGILAALPFLTMPLQVLTVGIVERFRRRKALSVVFWLIAQALWVPIALLPIFLEVPSAPAVSALLGIVALQSIFVAIQNSAWNSWLRDLVPQQTMGTFFARRLRYATIAAMGFGLAAALFVDYWRNPAGRSEALGYTIAILAGAVTLGLASPFFRMLMPEPEMPAAAGPRRSMLAMFADPFQDRNYRVLLVFHFLWAFAVHLAMPFFSVYMLTRLGLPVSAVLGFSVLSQLFNVIFLRFWGPLADRVGNKAVISVTSSLLLIVILGWTFTTMPERYSLTIPLLVVLHMLAGIASAGVNVSTGTIGLKMAPAGRATAYLAATSVVANLGAGLGPLVGGRLADFFSVRALTLEFSWTGPAGQLRFSPIHMTGFDFLFGLSFLLGLLSLNILTLLREQGEVSREVVMDALFAPMQRALGPMSTVPGLSLLTQFPFGYLRRVPLPGLDAVVGVTAYEIGTAAHAASTAVGRARSLATHIARAVDRSVSLAWGPGRRPEDQSMQVARAAARGAIRAVGEAALSAGSMARFSVGAVIRAMQEAGGNPDDYYWGIGYGVVEGAVEANADPVEAARGAIEAARAEARRADLEEARLVSRVGEGATEAARLLYPSAEEEIRKAARP
ncbi:MAG: MFS transporter [Chloroflexi bacterium]|nr:MFS transporter [Chloroflexota bacterium]